MLGNFNSLVRWTGATLAVTALSASLASAQTTGKLKVGFMLPYTGTFA